LKLRNSPLPVTPDNDTIDETVKEVKFVHSGNHLRLVLCQSPVKISRSEVNGWIHAM